MTKRLSDFQRQILIALARAYNTIEREGNDFDRHQLGIWGVKWRPHGKGNCVTTIDRASVSRTLRRLEERGLVRRRNQISGDRFEPDRLPTGEKPLPPPDNHRTTHVQLTDEGREEAENLLTKTATPNVNREDATAC